MPPVTSDHAAQPAPGALGTTTLLDRPLFRRVLIGVLLAVVVGLMVYIVNNAVTGNDASAVKPASVERLIPGSGAEILRQGQVGVDLANGYDAYLIINGVEIRNQATGEDADGLSKVLTPSGLTVTYTPAPGRRIEQLETDVNQVTAMVWRQTDGPSTASPVYWTFSAS